MKAALRPGRRRTLAAEREATVLHATLHTTSPGQTHWSTRHLTQDHGFSRMAVLRICQRPGLQTHRLDTTTLFATLVMLDGKVIGQCLPRHRSQEFVQFLGTVDANTPTELDLHLIVDNYSTHNSPTVKRWLKRHPRFHLHFIPTSSSSLNIIACWFREIATRTIRRGVFRSVPDLIAAIQRFLHAHNDSPKIFTWRKDAEAILAKIAKCKETLGTVQ